MKQGSIVASMCGAIGILLLASGVVLASGDNKKPSINISKDLDVTYVEGGDMNVLLEGVSAWDTKDKDVTSNLRIDKIIPNQKDGTATVIYVAYDKSNNVVKESRTVKYIGDSVTSDVPALNQDVQVANGENPSGQTLENPNGANQNQNGSNTEENQNGENPNGENPNGENTSEPASSEEMVSSGAPVIKLKQKEVTVNKGTSFAPLNYVEEIVDDKDDRSYMFRHINVVGDYSTQKSGTYTIKIYCTDSNGNKSNEETLTLKVK